MGKLDGKVAVITGSGRGIGKAIATLFAAEGAAVVVNDIDPVPAEETAGEIRKAGGRVASCAGDVTKAEDAQKIIETAVEKFGKLDILVNNAGLIRDALIHKMTDTQWDLCVDISMKGSFNCVRAAAKHMMRDKGNGKIINMSSISGLGGNIGQVNYSAAKSGLIGLTKTVAREWARFGVCCNAVAYGFVDTRMTAEKEHGETVMGEVAGIPKKVRDFVMLSLGDKAMKPEDAAKPVLFLASDDANFITGHVLNVSAGQYM